jgi:hypothetical protein
VHLFTHALLSWVLAEIPPLEARRDRILVLTAGLLPDLDALTILGGSDFYRTWHRMVFHNGLTAGVFALAAAAAATRRLPVFVLTLVAMHLHFLCDVIGSAGPDGSNWPVPYLVPFLSDERHMLRWEHQWQLASWQNMTVTLVALLVCIHLGATRGRTLVEAFSLRADRAVVEVLRRRWPFFSPPPPPRAPDAPPT